MKNSFIYKAFITLVFTLNLYPSFGFNKEFVWDTIKFEEPYPYITIDTTNLNCWQIGTPQKQLFDSAYSLQKAIITDSINSYPSNTQSYFELVLGTFNYDEGYFPYDIWLEFTHRYDTDTLKDGGYITVSYDNGISWQNIIEPFYSPVYPGLMYFENLYTASDSLTTGKNGFSGRSNGWTKSVLSWYVLPASTRSTTLQNEEGDTLRLRFYFISDGIDKSKDGWIIDDIKLYSVDLGDKIDTDESLYVKITPNPLTDISEVTCPDYEKLSMQVFDSNGHNILNKVFTSNEKIYLKRERFKRGIYFLQFKINDREKVIKKLIVE